jgi:hypothetical protein
MNSSSKLLAYFTYFEKIKGTHETATQIIFSRISPFHCTSTAAPSVAHKMSIWYSNALKLTHAQIHAHNHVRLIEHVSYVKL